MTLTYHLRAAVYNNFKVLVKYLNQEKELSIATVAKSEKSVEIIVQTVKEQFTFYPVII